MKVFLIAILTFLLGWQIGHRDVALSWANYHPSVSVSDKTVPNNVNVDFRLFWDTWDLLSKTYIYKKALDPQKMFYGAISGMVASLGDPYTVFLPPAEQKSTTEELNGSFDGVGIQLGFDEEKKLVVIAPLSGTPAEKAGVKPNDFIIKIDDKDTNGMSLPEAVKLIRGVKGKKIEIKSLREGETDTRVFTLTRDTIIVKSVEVSYKQSLPSGEGRQTKTVAIIKLSRFGDRTNDEWIQAVSDINSKNPSALILDVRNNPGGYLEGAVFIASEFLDGGNVVLQENNEGVKTQFKANRVGKLLNIPMVVLINKGSASASEIVAGALQDRNRAKLIGEKSFGKGTIQEAQNLANNTGIHITVAKWLTPNSRWVNELGGLDPDVKIEMDKEDITKDLSADRQDPQLDKALEMFD